MRDVIRRILGIFEILRNSETLIPTYHQQSVSKWLNSGAEFR